jgi:hypothetical protein
MPANRVPTPILEARGSFASHKNRKTARAGEPVETRPLGGPPRTFTEEQRKLWREFARMVPTGVATYADRWGVELIVAAMTKYRAGTAKSMDMQQISSLLARFGLTPADRSRVAATLAPKVDDEWLDIDEPKTIL